VTRRATVPRIRFMLRLSRPPKESQMRAIHLGSIPLLLLSALPLAAQDVA